MALSETLRGRGERATTPPCLACSSRIQPGVEKVKVLRDSFFHLLVLWSQLYFKCYLLKPPNSLTFISQPK